MNKDYEAIGRYVDAAESVASLSTQRHNIAAELARMLRKASLFGASASCDTVQVFDYAGVLKRAEELARINALLEAAIAEVNGYAQAAQKPAVLRI